LTDTSLQAPVPRIRLAAGELLWWLLVVAASAATAWLTMRQLQLGCTVALLALTLGLYLRSRNAGVVCVWLLWLLSPWVRRLFGLAGPYVSADPLALAPFLATGAVAALELARAPLSRTAKRVLGLAGLGYGIGVPAGLGAPQSMGFALFAYLAAVSAFGIGYREPPERGRLTLQTLLVTAMPIISVYGILQYFSPLPQWDAVWLESVQDTLNSVGAPEEGKIRVFATLNAPGALGMVLGMTALCLLALRRFNPIQLVSLILVLTALALTFVRSAWVSLIVGLFVLLLASRGRAVGRIVVVISLIAMAIMGFAGSNSAGQAVVGRFNTLGDPSSDVSAKARVATPSEVVPQAVAQPAGSGLGSAGEATRLGAGGNLRNTDNAWLSLLVQVGPFGFALVIAAAATAVKRAVSTMRRSSDPVDVLVVGLIAFLFVAGFTGDILYGLTGVFTWYLFGAAVRRNEVLTATARGAQA
jgi:putative inorganic carbon (HCO3(-)) transporter